MSRRITVTLSLPQYRALASAVAARSAELDGDGAGQSQESTTLNRAWGKVNRAWHERSKP